MTEYEFVPVESLSEIQPGAVVQGAHSGREYTVLYVGEEYAFCQYETSIGRKRETSVRAHQMLKRVEKPEVLPNGLSRVAPDEGGGFTYRDWAGDTAEISRTDSGSLRVAEVESCSSIHIPREVIEFVLNDDQDS